MYSSEHKAQGQAHAAVVAVDSHKENAAHQDAIKLIATHVRGICRSSDMLPSPCVSVCRISADSGLCEGCFRTLGEISAWSRLPADDKRALWRTIEQRIVQIERTAAPQPCGLGGSQAASGILSSTPGGT